MRHLFEKSLDHLQELVTNMGNKVGDVITNTIQAFKTQDKELALKVATSDNEINAMEHEIEQLCLSLIARQQPLATDLRVITSSLKIITDIERVADQCADICQIINRSEDYMNVKAHGLLIKMLEAASSMYFRSISAYINHNVELAKEVCAGDDEVDSMFEKIVLELSAYLSASANVMPGVNLMFIAKYGERLADHATNIGEWTIFLVDAVHPDSN
ncbi:MAG: phosphate transport system regulatory protein PhoU [Clostridiales bacterium 43-6]|nr:MAG: phosphate transport system regulatory protein PhoU [Clostridiales bacterium 43-6]